MEQIELGTTGMQVSRLGLGTVELGIPYGLSEDPPPTDEVCIRLLRDAHDQGITYIDTAAAYGRSEELVGLAFSGMQDRPTITTKVAFRDSEGNPVGPGRLRQHIEASVERSLQWLQADRLDILKIHSADDRFLSDELVESMQLLVERGRVRSWGASTYETIALADALSEPKLRVIQVAYSLLDRRLDDELLPRARVQGVGIVLRSVFLKGVLSDRRRQLSQEMAPLARAADAAARIAAEAGLALSQVALRFALFSGAGDVTLVGTAQQEELQENLEACAAGPLPEDVVAALMAIEVEDSSLLNPGNWPTEPVHSKQAH
ncbi:MAG: aldo/keto reductase [Gemmatimonadetes bacterium]|nr:aldo/keto reductase [Gemmatimonadota bacterium]MBT7859232.1 aldo/keto reductase [Gemmatimonadota bacterium]